MTKDFHFAQGDALLVVDVQNDFCPGGALAIDNGDAVVPVLNRLIADARDKGVPVLASRDWHPHVHVSFEPAGGPWPVHCVQDTDGAAFRRDLELPEDVIVVTKGTRFDQDQYSAFDQTGLGDFLHKRGIKRVWVGGLAEDVCVQATVLDARKAGFEAIVVGEATRPVTDEGGEKARTVMKEAGAVFIDEHGAAL